MHSCFNWVTSLSFLFAFLSLLSICFFLLMSLGFDRVNNHHVCPFSKGHHSSISPRKWSLRSQTKHSWRPLHSLASIQVRLNSDHTLLSTVEWLKCSAFSILIPIFPTEMLIVQGPPEWSLVWQSSLCWWWWWAHPLWRGQQLLLKCWYASCIWTCLHL